MVTNRVGDTNEYKAMSKSLGNGVDPDEMIEAFGADATRLFVLFAAPVENELRWSETGIEGAVRFLRRVWTMVYKWRGTPCRSAGSAGIPPADFSDAACAAPQDASDNRRVTADFDKLDLNTNVAALMELSNALAEFNVDPQALQTLMSLLSAKPSKRWSSCWRPSPARRGRDVGRLGHTNGLLKSAQWPVADPELRKKDELEIPVQVNGKLRSRVIVAPDISEADLRELALADTKVQSFIDGQKVVKVIVVPQRLVNVVVK
jgi:leucyl-tRNA synthetase